MKKGKKIIYWVATLWLALGMVSTGMVQLLKVESEGALAPPGVWGISQLGYPVYILTLLGVWKLLGAIAVLLPKFPLVKEWAYAGFFFIMTGALYSHASTGSPAVEYLPSLLLLVLTIVSWYTRPSDRKLVALNQS